MVKVSVIVPLFNKEKEIKKCMNSLVNQTFKDMEIIIVNDGSTDQSMNICLSYQKRYKNIKVFKKENEGVERARLFGLKKSKGLYVTFVDSDDWLSHNAIEEMVTALEENDSDVSIIPYYRTIGKIAIIKFRRNSAFYENQIIFNETFINKYLQSFCGWGEFPVSIWGKLYKKDLLWDIKLSELTYGEDICFNLQVLPRAKKMAIASKAHYYYRWGG